MNGINRRDFLAAGGAVLTGLAYGAAANQAGSRKSKRLNVVLYVVDDQGTADAGCYGNPAVKTPGLDEIAAESVRFTNAFCTSASCSASRSVILTGKFNHATGHYGHSHDIHHFRTFDDVVSLPKILKHNGYRNINIGKCHVQPPEVYPFDVQYGVTNPEKMAELARPFIEEKSDEPFFLYFATCEPHRPFNRETSDPVSPDDVIVPDYLPDIPECRRELAEYYGSLQQADKGLIRLMNILKQSGHWDDTIIVYLSDNGIAFPGAKTTVYEPGIHLPMVVRDPRSGGGRGLVNNAMVSYVDITPTLLDIVGIDAGDTEFHGSSFASVMNEANPKGRDEVYASHTFHEVTMYYPMRVVRERRYKLIWNLAHELDYPFASDLYASKTWQAVLKRNISTYGKRSVDAYLHRPEFELYDLQTDPNEVVNLAYNTKYSETFERMKKKLKEFQQRTNDPWIVKWEYE
jgi:N-sulfoglucosamine sulfohydrolase